MCGNASPSTHQLINYLCGHIPAVIITRLGLTRVELKLLHAEPPVTLSLSSFLYLSLFSLLSPSLFLVFSTSLYLSSLSSLFLLFSTSLYSSSLSSLFLVFSTSLYLASCLTPFSNYVFFFKIKFVVYTPRPAGWKCVCVFT